MMTDRQKLSHPYYGTNLQRICRPICLREKSDDRAACRLHRLLDHQCRIEEPTRLGLGRIRPLVALRLLVAFSCLRA